MSPKCPTTALPDCHQQEVLAKKNFGDSLEAPSLDALPTNSKSNADVGAKCHASNSSKNSKISSHPHSSPFSSPRRAATAADRLASVRSSAERLTCSLRERSVSTRNFLNGALRHATGSENICEPASPSNDQVGVAEMSPAGAGSPSKSHSSSTLSPRVRTIEEDVGAAVSYVASSTASACRGTLQRMPPFIRKLKYAPLGAAELFGASSPPFEDGGPEAAATVTHYAQECWNLWRRKHAALSASELLYASLLSDSRRTDALSAEVSAVESLLQSEFAKHSDCQQASSSTASADEHGDETASHCEPGEGGPIDENAARIAFVRCCDALEAQARESKAAIRERVRHYPCGLVCEVTGHLRIARVKSDIDAVLKRFDERVDLERQDAVTQALEITVVPCVAALADALSRRLAFWESEIEESWAHWSAQAGVFHDACRGTAEFWTRFRDATMNLMEKLADASCRPPEDTPPIVYLVPFLDIRAIQHHRRWDEAHEALVKAGAMLAVLGAWTEYHNLRGDGEILHQARDLLVATVESLKTRFDPSKYSGSEAIQASLAADETWSLVAPLAEDSWFHRRERGDDITTPSSEKLPWWSPRSWTPGADDNTETAAISNALPAAAEALAATTEAVDVASA